MIPMDSSASSSGTEPVHRIPPVEGSTPAQQILRLYGQGIAGCLRRDPRQVAAVLMELIAALNFDYAEAAAAFFRLYDHCLHEARARRFGEPLRILQGLHEGWSRAIAAAPRHEI